VPAESPVKSLAGKEVSLRVSIKEVRSRKVPALDDELAKDSGEADTLADLRTKVREKLVEAENQRIKREMSVALVKDIVKVNPFEVAPSLVDRYAEDMVMRTKSQLMMMGIDVEAGGFNETEMLKEVRADAEAEAKANIWCTPSASAKASRPARATCRSASPRSPPPAAKARKSCAPSSSTAAASWGSSHRSSTRRRLICCSSQAKIVDEDPDSLIITPDKAGAERLIVTPEEAAAETAKRGKRK
jgi:hypothetical protein